MYNLMVPLTLYGKSIVWSPHIYNMISSGQIQKSPLCVLKIVSSWCRNCVPVTCLEHGCQGHTSHQSHRSHSTCRHMCFSNTENFPYPRSNHFGTYKHVLPFVTQKQKRHPQFTQYLPKRLCTMEIIFQIKYWNEIHYKYEAEEYLAYPSYQQMQVQK